MRCFIRADIKENAYNTRESTDFMLVHRNEINCASTEKFQNLPKRSSNVFRRRVSNIDDLKARITTAIGSVDADMLAATWREIDNRLDILRATKVAHVEVH
ncbi:hypothetical protein HNY73_016176 [Argiope bruennichi]|uniref:Uncharacterized protein n=1 Tax=Argiope bruennichi TaxID=94029 RepID=A0A8T0EI48_ARGBR|nr:hypothetical protein HNY73_016176 [Argiope bruennichi]